MPRSDETGRHRLPFQKRLSADPPMFEMRNGETEQNRRRHRTAGPNPPLSDRLASVIFARGVQKSPEMSVRVSFPETGGNIRRPKGRKRPSGRPGAAGRVEDPLLLPSVRCAGLEIHPWIRNICSVQGRGSPVHGIFFHAMPLPLRREILRCRSKLQAASLAFAHTPRLGFLFSLLRGLFDDAAGFTSCYGLACCSPCLRQVLSSMRFCARISPYLGSRLRGELGPSRDRTSAGQKMRTFLGTRHKKRASFRKPA